MSEKAIIFRIASFKSMQMNGGGGTQVHNGASQRAAYHAVSVARYHRLSALSSASIVYERTVAHN